MPRPSFDCRFLTVALAVFAATFLLAPSRAAALSQHDWMVTLVDSLGRSFGLPDEPKPEDYSAILVGRRTLTLEAEAVRSDGDEVSTLAFTNFGPFTGTGWLLGTGRSTPVHLRFTLPLDGRYRLSMSARLPGHTIQAGGRTFTADGGALHFARTEIGEVELKAGLQEIIVTLPPGGAIDALELKAPALPMIAPAAGWQPETPLDWNVLALTAVQALHLEEQLPAGEQIIVVEAESLAGTGGAQVVQDAHLGRPSGGRWLRTSAQPAVIEAPLANLTWGFYDLILTMMGDPVELLTDGHRTFTLSGKPYLTELSVPAVFLRAGTTGLTVTLPPGGGLDRIELKARQIDLKALCTVLGLEPGSAPPGSADLDRLSARLISAPR